MMSSQHVNHVHINTPTYQHIDTLPRINVQRTDTPTHQQSTSEHTHRKVLQDRCLVPADLKLCEGDKNTSSGKTSVFLAHDTNLVFCLPCEFEVRPWSRIFSAVLVFPFLTRSSTSPTLNTLTHEHNQISTINVDTLVKPAMCCMCVCVCVW